MKNYKIKIYDAEFSIYHLIELATYSFIALPLFLPILPMNDFFNGTFQEWMRLFITFPFLFIVTIALFFIKLGKDDYRFRIIFHFLTITIMITYVIFIWQINGLFSTDNDFVEVLSTTWGPVIIVLVLGSAIFFSVMEDFEKYFRELNTALEGTKKHDYSYRITDRKLIADPIFNNLADTLNEVMDTIDKTIDDLNSTQVLIETSKEIKNNSIDLNMITDNLSKTSSILNEGASVQTRGINKIIEELHNLQNIFDKVNSKIINNSNTVSQIALQTNILALNAGIEASRAGDYGRGFAVVAENVRKLSDASKIASEEITAISESITQQIRTAVENVLDNMERIAEEANETLFSATELQNDIDNMNMVIDKLNISGEILINQAEKTVGSIQR